MPLIFIARRIHHFLPAPSRVELYITEDDVDVTLTREWRVYVPAVRLNLVYASYYDNLKSAQRWSLLGHTPARWRLSFARRAVELIRNVLYKTK